MQRILILFCFLFLGQLVVAQQDTVLASKIFIENANRQITDVSGSESIQYFYGDVKVYKDSVFMFCDSARLVGSDLFTALGNVVFVQSDTIKIFCDSLVYNSNTDVVDLYENVSLENGEQQLFTDKLKYNTGIKLATYQDTALLLVDKTQLQSIQGIYDVDNKIATFYNEVIVQNDEIVLRTDSLEYLSELKRTLFLGPTRIIDDGSKIYCESGYYDLSSKNAEFAGSPQFIDDLDTATAEVITYNALDSILTLKDNAIYKRPDQIAIGEEIVQDQKTGLTTISGQASFKDKENIMDGDTLIYNKNTKAVSVKGKANYVDGASTLDATNLDYNSSTGNGLAQGNVTYTDTSSNFSLKAEQLFIKDSTQMKAIGGDTRPYLINKLEEDTMYLAADTLYRSQLVERDTLGAVDSINFFSGKGKVKILEKSFTAICDSISFNDQDSIFRLFNQPVVWSDSTQFSGDSILIYLKDDTVDKIEIIESGFIINELEPEVYNQITGKLINVYFRESELDSMEVNGSAESLYFFQDEEDAYIGVNRTLCGHMTFYFKEKDLDDIKFYQKPESVLTPMEDVDLSSQRIKGFNWQIKKSPLNLASIIRKD